MANHKESSAQSPKVPAVTPVVVSTVQGASAPPTLTGPTPAELLPAVAPVHPNANIHTGLARGQSPTETQSYREVFWQNVIREMLISLIIAQAESQAQIQKEKPSAEPMSDGRVGIVTAQGQRIPIGRVSPVFAATFDQTPKMIELSHILQCTVFQIETPGGEVYTLPLHEIRGFHAISERTMDQVSNAAREQRYREGSPEEAEPFGFAAFTSLARSSGATGNRPDDPTGPAGAD